jgi:mannose-6-phosphate isomerase-like protein (cupin superfamily)
LRDVPGGGSHAAGAHASWHSAGGAPPDQQRPAAMSGRAEVKFVPKPWGHETIWAHTDRYVGKILHVKAGQALSVQYHERKDETVYLLAGEMKYWVKLEGQEELTDVNLKVGDAFRITPGTIHYMEAVTDCDVLEASTPELDDVVRLKDRYGREGTSAA